jgi:DNA (cytosine-5)-methyltransferase 1
MILSLFPGLGLLDMAFESEGFCVVRGPDVIWGGDIRRFHPPAGVFAGIIGGPPCQSFSSLAHLVRANGHEPKFGNLIPEFERCVLEAQPAWFLMENVRAAPEAVVTGYGTKCFLLDNAMLDSGDGHGEEQTRLDRKSVV